MRKNQQTEQSRHKKAGMSKKHHEADARRALLEIFLLRMRNETGEGYDERFRQVFSSDVFKVVEAAYRRGDLLEKRRALMADWASYCSTKPAKNVIPIGGRAAA